MARGYGTGLYGRNRYGTSPYRYEAGATSIEASRATLAPTRFIGVTPAAVSRNVGRFLASLSTEILLGATAVCANAVRLSAGRRTRSASIDQNASNAQASGAVLLPFAAAESVTVNGTKMTAFAVLSFAALADEVGAVFASLSDVWQLEPQPGGVWQNEPTVAGSWQQVESGAGVWRPPQKLDRGTGDA